MVGRADRAVGGFRLADRVADVELVGWHRFGSGLELALAVTAVPVVRVAVVALLACFNEAIAAQRWRGAGLRAALPLVAGVEAAAEPVLRVAALAARAIRAAATVLAAVADTVVVAGRRWAGAAVGGAGVTGFADPAHAVAAAAPATAAVRRAGSRGLAALALTVAAERFGRLRCSAGPRDQQDCHAGQQGQLKGFHRRMAPWFEGKGLLDQLSGPAPGLPCRGGTK